METTPSRWRLTNLARQVQHRIASALHIDEAGRSGTVVTMLANNARRAPGYWIQLVLATGIATLGLVLNSTAVVIGAMLVSPLMGPLVELGMGFAVGSSLLVMRASLRVMLSVAIAIGAAALITVALPFHEITAEVSARAAPTVLDLLVAMFCALTAAYTTVRPGSDTTAAAAGTAVGIALVPPLCAIGFGIGSGSAAVAGGAALLFTANFSAILLLTAVSFLLLGFNQVDAAALELDFVDQGTLAYHLAARLHRRLRSVFGYRYGVVMRALIPLAFLAAVYVPLNRALDEVTWEVRTRDAVRRLVREASPGAVQTQITVERRRLTLRLLIVGTTARAVAIEDTLVARLARVTGVTPSVTVVAVPNARLLMAQASALARTAAAPPPPTAPVEDLRARAAAALAEVWPVSAGPRAGWHIAVPSSDSVVLTVLHLGTPIGDAGDALLGRALEDRLRAPVIAHSMALPATPIMAQPSHERAWLDSAVKILAAVATTDSAVACVRGPIAPQQRASKSKRAAIADLRQSQVALSARMTIQNAARLDIRVGARTCDDTRAGGSNAATTSPMRALPGAHR